MKCKKCGQWIVRLEDGTPDCGCYQEPDPNYPSLDRQVDPSLAIVNGREEHRHFSLEDY